jgi:hypothetical protein
MLVLGNNLCLLVWIWSSSRYGEQGRLGIVNQQTAVWCVCWAARLELPQEFVSEV